MAYGVKYRLIFSDVLGYRKKVEILKKDYTGDVLPMVGAAEPVVVQWNSKNDFYTPIIGSSCKLNLLVTDTIQYDEFYKFDEREYQVKVSYSKTKSEIYSDRVLDDASYSADSGFVESLECIESFLGQFYTLSTYYEDRVNNDGGIVESLDCVSNAINDEPFDVWGTYWIGWLVVDRFIEKMTTTPYNISFNAFDGLGTLDQYDAPLSTNSFGTTDSKRIFLILDNLDLSEEIIYLNDLTYKNQFGIPPVAEYNKFPNFTTIPFEDNYELKDGLDLFNAKEQLELLLKTYNMRVFQSYGKWFIVEVSNIFDIRVKDQIIALNEGLNPPDNIRDLITLKLKSNKNEFLQYTDDSGLNKNISVLKTVPSELVPLNNDLTREYLQPLKSVVRTLTTTQLEKSYYNYNPGFEYDDDNWDIADFGAGNRAQIETNTIDKQGAKSMSLNAATSGISNSCFDSDRTTQIENAVLEYTKFELSYYVETTGDVDATIQYQIVSNRTPSSIYWNNETKVWQSAQYINQIGVSQLNTWNTVTGSFKLPSEFGLDADTNLRSIQIRIFNTTISGSTTEYNNTYFDNVGIFQQNTQFDIVGPESAPVSEEIKITTTRGTGTANYSAKKEFDTLLYPYKTVSNTLISDTFGFLRSRDRALESGDDKLDFVYNINNQNVMNDYREFVTRYTGSFRGLKPTPLSLHNKIWFNWPDTIEDPQSTIIDGLTYGVKSGVYKVKAHLPNNDNDLSIETKKSG